MLQIQISREEDTVEQIPDLKLTLKEQSLLMKLNLISSNN